MSRRFYTRRGKVRPITPRKGRRRPRIPKNLRPRNRMNTRSNRELVYGHAILHHWAERDYAEKPPNWTKKQIRQEHDRLVKIARKRGLPMGKKHRTPIE